MDEEFIERGNGVNGVPASYSRDSGLKTRDGDKYMYKSK
jgi:hypothetical protein